MTPPWEALALVRSRVLRDLRQRYPTLPLQDCEDAVSEASLRVAAHGTVAHLRAYLFTAARHALWHQGRRQEAVGARLHQYALLRAHEVAGPAEASAAAHDLAWYLSQLTPQEQARLEASVWEGAADYGSGGHSTTTRTWAYYLRTKLRRARVQEDKR
jgi:DNA-directed RNA polymerase specialized sigma24 family protein